jgi:hypothetical protein
MRFPRIERYRLLQGEESVHHLIERVVGAPVLMSSGGRDKSRSLAAFSR